MPAAEGCDSAVSVRHDYEEADPAQRPALVSAHFGVQDHSLLVAGLVAAHACVGLGRCGVPGG